MGKIRIAYFLEDIAHEKFLRTLVARVAQQTGLSNDDLVEEVRNATGGSPRVFSELRMFLTDIQSVSTSLYQILIVATDSNCAKYTEVRVKITAIIQRAGYHDPVVLAIPNPYIERWYVMDAEAFKSATDATVVSKLPRKHRQRYSYKKILREALLSAGIKPILGGAEYGEEIAMQIDLYKAEKADRSFGRFVRDLRRELGKLAQDQ